MNVSVGFPTVFFFSFGLTPPGYLAFFIVAHIVTFSRDIGSALFLLFFLDLRSSRSSRSKIFDRLDYQCDQLFFPFDFVSIPFCPLSISNHILTLRGFCLFFSLFSFSPLLCLLVPESLWIFLIKLPRLLLFLSLYLVFLRVSTQGKFQRRAFAFFLKALPIRSLSRSPSQGMYTFLFLQRASASVWVTPSILFLSLSFLASSSGSSLGPTFFYLP